MNIKFSEKLPVGLVKAIGKTGMWWQRNGSLVLNGAGIVSMLAGTYFGVQAGRKVDALIGDIQLRIEKAKETGDEKLLKNVKIHCAKEICALFGLPVGLSLAGAVMVTSGTLKQRKQVAGLAAAYCGVLAEYKDLKERAAKSIETAAPLWDKDNNPLPYEKGVEINKKHLERGGTLVHNEEDPEHKELVFHYDLNSPYEFLFDCRSYHFKRNDVYANLSFLKGAWELINTKYHTGVPIFLSEVLEYLGMEKTKASLYEGWYIKAPGADKDLSFGIEPFFTGDAHYSDYEFLMEGIPLRFNVVGPIAYLLNEKDSDI